MQHMTNWSSGLAQAHASGEPHILITILAIKGSAPRQGGGKMVVTVDKVFDTIGGGQLELLAIERSRRILNGNLPAVQQIEHYPLAAAAMLNFAAVTVGTGKLCTVATVARSDTTL